MSEKPFPVETLEEVSRQFELAKLDYQRLATQEQALMNKRTEHWNKFFTVLAVPSGYAGIVGLRHAIFVLAFIPFFIACISLEIKHDEQVLRYDVRKQMKLLAASWGFANHDSLFALASEHQKKRFWHGYYKHCRGIAFIGAQILASAVVSLSTSPFVLSLALLVLNAVFIVFTTCCLL
jgi:hypothetical protein